MQVGWGCTTTSSSYIRLLCTLVPSASPMLPLSTLFLCDLKMHPGPILRSSPLDIQILYRKSSARSRTTEHLRSQGQSMSPRVPSKPQLSVQLVLFFFFAENTAVKYHKINKCWVNSEGAPQVTDSAHGLSLRLGCRNTADGFQWYYCNLSIQPSNFTLVSNPTRVPDAQGVVTVSLTAERSVPAWASLYSIDYTCPLAFWWGWHLH